MPQRTSRRKAGSSRSARLPTGLRSTSQQTELLPSIDGPKLGPFRSPGFDTSSDFQFETLLDEPSSSGGGEGFVFKATLNGLTYALKLFKFFDIEEGRFRFSRSQNAQISDEELIGNLDPFYAECRAYGRIEEIHAKYRAKNVDNGPIAVPCYGYILISASDERRIVAQFGPLDVQRYEKDIGAPLRALVKQYIPTEPINPKIRSVKRMLRDLRMMHQNGVYPIDIRAENYREGLLVDFGMALTEPSCVLRVVDEDIAEHERGRGLGAFDRMIRKAGIKTQVRATTGSGWKHRTRAGVIARGGGELLQLVNKRGTRAEAQSR
ncbi:hypothetical protein N0V90_007971 [Kalmusia sp. IMI 367209]|nr:hypothetical protein N0V90_007971 [Kalmusia sp. IMI 367209]